jgi:predicted ester cyclase
MPSSAHHAGSTARERRPAPKFYAGWFEAFPDAHVEIHGLHIAGDAAVEEGTFTGTHRGTLRSPAGDIAPTGRAVAMDYIQVLRFRDGKHISFNLIFDRLLMLDQLGLIPAPAPAG